RGDLELAEVDEARRRRARFGAVAAREERGREVARALAIAAQRHGAARREALEADRRGLDGSARVVRDVYRDAAGELRRALEDDVDVSGAREDGLDDEERDLVEHVREDEQAARARGEVRDRVAAAQDL